MLRGGLAAFGVVAFGASTLNAEIIFSEDFGTLAHGTALSTSNTGLTIFNTATSAFITANNPSPISTGASADILTPAMGSNRVGFGVAGLPSAEVVTFSMTFSTNYTAGFLNFGMGSGGTAESTAALTAADMMWAIRLSGSTFKRMSGTSWIEINEAEEVENGEIYTLHIVANGSASSVNYGNRTLSPGQLDLYINGELLSGGSTAMQNSRDATAFRLYSTSSLRTSYQIDDITIWNEAVPVPEPTMATLLAIAGVAGLMRARR